MNDDRPRNPDPRDRGRAADPRRGQSWGPHGPGTPQQQPRGNVPPPPPHGHVPPPRRGNVAPPQRGNVPPPRYPAPTPAYRQQPGPPPGEGTQVIRRDGRPAAPRAWSEEPVAPRPAAPGPGGPGPQSRSEYAPTQTPQPYIDPQRRRPPPPASPPPPPPRSGRPGTEPPANPPRPSRRRRHWGRRIGLIPLVLVILMVVSVVYLDRSLNRIDALADYPGRIADTPGTNWLLVGSDSREGLTAEQDQELSAGGDIAGKRTDTIIVIHVPKSGAATMVSIPRDSYVNIPGWGEDKINASFAIDGGGPQLLVRTVEEATGLRMDHYAEIGFGGFAGIVDAIGGVNLCVPYPIDDPLAGINLQPGCQDLTGAEALGFVRTRATPLADLDRMNNQRLFMAALLDKATSLGTMLNPFRLWSLVTDTAGSLLVDDGDHLWNLASLAWAMRGDLITTTVPVGGFEDVSGSGNVLLWDQEKASRFFEALANDEPVPADLITAN